MHDLTNSLVERIRVAFPEIAIKDARLRSGEGQFNRVLVVNQSLIFRFPRTSHVAATLAQEVAVLQQLHGRLSLPIPKPTFLAYDNDGTLALMGYEMIPGEPLWNESLAVIIDHDALDRMAKQLAGFLRTLHQLPIKPFTSILTPANDVVEWQAIFAQFRDKLYSFMRPDAQRQITELGENLLDDLRLNPPNAVLRHGDFGGSNILYDAQTLGITGVVDFGFSGLGDPAGDIASFSCFGESFVRRALAVYPEMEHMLPRARLYRGTFALLQALYALRDGNQADFDDGIAAYI